MAATDDAALPPPPGDYEAMDAAVERYRARFGVGPPVWQFMGRPRDLARELDAAVARGERVTDTELYRRLGMEPPPPGACL
jgi:hypothetical protein